MVGTGPFSFKFVLAIAGALVVMIGIRRYSELREHTHKLDRYLMAAEKNLVPESGGWTTHYHEGIQGKIGGGYSTTRLIFWAGLVLIVALCFVLAMGKTTPAGAL